jgi:hypothetical protein
MDSQETRKIFFKALRYYKLRARGLSTLVYYRDFSWNEMHNSWPLIATIPLLGVFNVSAIVLGALYWRELLLPATDASGNVSYVSPLVFIGLLLFVIYTTYKFLRAVFLLWRMSHDHSFDAGFPPEIKVK